MKATLLDAPEQLPASQGVRGVSATDADIREFRTNLMLVRKRNRSFVTRLRQATGQALSIPLAMLYGFKGISHYGAGVKKQYKIGLPAQFDYLFRDHLSYKILPEGFYMYRLFLPQNRKLSATHFSFLQILPMEQHLIDCADCPDFPLLRSKHRFAQRCAEAGLPCVPVLAEFSEGVMTPSSANGGSKLPDADLFSKPSEYWCGIGANLWVNKSRAQYTNALSGEMYDKDALIKKLCEDSRSGRIVLQQKASNHSSMIGSITSGGLATLRLVTCRTPSGSIELLPPVIRMPVRGAIVDNIAQGGLAAPIDIATGKICGPAVRKDKALGISIYEKHPDSGVNFVGFQIPFWREAFNLAVQAHLAFPSLPFVGWDVAVLQDGPVLLEGNAWWDVDLTTLPHGLSLTDTQFIPYYNYHLRQATAGLQAK